MVMLVVVMVTEKSIADFLTDKEGKSPGKGNLYGVGNGENEGSRAKTSYSPAEAEEDRSNN